MHAATLATDGYVVLRDVVTPEQLAALRAECDALCAALAAEGVCLADEGCVVEVFRRSRPEPRAAARTERAAYDAARRQALCGGVGAEQRDAAVERALFQSLPAAVQGALGADAPLWLFNEQHVVKPARSTCTFAWHRDAEEQLALCTDLGLQQGSSTPYVSVWLPLDDCSARNGTLVVLPRFEVRFSCMHCVADKSDVRAVPCSRGSLSKQQTLGASRWTCRPVEHAHSRATYGTPAAATAATRHGASSTRSTARRRSRASTTARRCPSLSPWAAPEPQAAAPRAPARCGGGASPGRMSPSGGRVSVTTSASCSLTTASAETAS
jgi:hypothetical protein